MTNLDQAVIVFNGLRDQLLAQFPELAEDETTLLDTLEGITDLNEALVAVFESAEQDKLMAEALSARMDAMATRQARFASRQKAKREAIARAMEAAGRKKIEAPSVTLSLRAVPPSVLITDENAIPSEFWKETLVRKVDKTAIKDALGHREIPGATLSNGGSSLNARVK